MYLIKRHHSSDHPFIHGIQSAHPSHIAEAVVLKYNEKKQANQSTFDPPLHLAILRSNQREPSLAGGYQKQWQSLKPAMKGWGWRVGMCYEM